MIAADPRRARLLHTVWLGLSIAGVALLLATFALYGSNGHDAFAYWRHDSDLYGNALDSAGGQGVYRYSPAFAQAISPLWVLPWEVFRFAWLGASLAALAWVGRRHTLWLLVLPPVLLELWIGNIHLFMAAAIVAGFRYSAAWAFLLLTKVTPGIGLLWFAVRREWSRLAVAVGATLAVVVVSILVGGWQIWAEWIDVLQAGPRVEALWWIPLPPLALRLAIAALLVAWGALTDRAWTVPVAATLALPTVWGHGLAMLVAVVPLLAAQAHRPESSGSHANAPAAPALGSS